MCITLRLISYRAFTTSRHSILPHLDQCSVAWRSRLSGQSCVLAPCPFIRARKASLRQCSSRQLMLPRGDYLYEAEHPGEQNGGGCQRKRHGKAALSHEQTRPRQWTKFSGG